MYRGWLVNYIHTFVTISHHYHFQAYNILPNINIYASVVTGGQWDTDNHSEHYCEQHNYMYILLNDHQ